MMCRRTRFQSIQVTISLISVEPFIEVEYEFLSMMHSDPGDSPRWYGVVDSIDTLHVIIESTEQHDTIYLPDLSEGDGIDIIGVANRRFVVATTQYLRIYEWDFNGTNPDTTSTSSGSPSKTNTETATDTSPAPICIIK